MPTSTGQETLDERIARLRGELATTRTAIERIKTNGRSFDMGGAIVTQAGLANLESTATRVAGDLRRLEALRATGRPAAAIAQGWSR